MEKRMTDLFAYEKRLLEDRQQLSKLIEESNVNDTKIVQEKLEFFQREIEYLNRQVQYIKQDMEKQEGISHQISNASPKSSGLENTGIPQQMPYKTSNVPEIKMENAGLPKQISLDPPKTPVVAEKRDMEKTVGKSLMGILASGLIFISLILFATLLLPYFNDTAKMITTYVVSFAFTGIGLFKLRKDKENKFFVALTGCGIGAVYISLLLSNMYFKVIGDIVLYVLICIWGMGVCVLARLENKIFQVIGELGILISVIFGCVLCDADNDQLKFLVLIIYYMISTSVFYIVHYKEEFCENLIHHVFHGISCVILVWASLDIIKLGVNVSAILLLLLLVLSLGSMFFHKTEKSNISFGIFAGIYLCMIFGMVFRILDNDLAYAITAYILFVIFMLILQFKKVNGKAGKNILYLVLTAMAITALNSYDNMYEYGVLPMLIVPLLLLGFYNKNSVCKYTALVLLFFYTFGFYPMNELLHFGLELMAFVMVFYLIYKCKEQYSRAFKYFAHIVALLFLLTGVGDMAGDVTTYMVVAVFNIVMLKSCFGKNLATDEGENPALYHIVNLAAMIYGIGMLGADWEPVSHFLLILTVVATFTVNAKNILDKRNNIFAGMYVGFKFTLLMIFILNSFDAVNYVISISCFVFAILSIVIGFMKDYKALRIFGLILSMISTFKLIMVDITYDNTLGNALSFFISGVLCFGISLIYNYIDGKVKRENK